MSKSPSKTELNTFTAALAEVCEKHLLAPKWVIAPSLRVGYQWLDAVTASGVSIVNARVMTMEHMVLGLVQSEMRGKGLAFLRGWRAEVLVDSLLRGEKKGKGGYLYRMSIGQGLVRAVRRALGEIRLAGLDAAGLKERAFEVGLKGKEIKRLLGAYERELEKRRLADYAGALRLALGKEKPVEDGVLLIKPDDIELCKLERELWEKFPAAQKVAVAVDNGPPTGTGKLDDARLLSWYASPEEAPKGKAMARQGYIARWAK